MFCAWIRDLGSEALYNKEANYKIEKAFAERGQAAADAERACITSGDSSCQPNTLPSPTQVWSSLQSLIAVDQNILGMSSMLSGKLSLIVML